jgi:radical SAM protein with 4Fe4S-binding SPASM domain
MGGLLSNCWKATKALATRRVDLECDRIPYRFEGVPLKKLLNWIRTEASIYVKPRQPWGWPTHLQVEPTAHCDLRCALCPVSGDLGRPRGFMSLELYRRLIDEIGDYVFLLLLWDWGEPFLHPELDQMISYARGRGMRVVCSTNGHRLRDAELAERTVRSGLDTLIFALDGISQETYERYRRNGKLEAVLEGIRTVVAKKRELRSETPLVNLRFIAMKYNEHEIPRLPDLAHSLGVDALTLKTLFPGHDCDPAQDQENPFIPTEPHFRRFRYDEATLQRIREKRNPCKVLWNNPVIHWDGGVCSCSFDFQRIRPFGDLNSAPLKQIWRGAAYGDSRREFRDHWEAMRLCRDCSYAYAGGNCARETIAEAHFLRPDGSCA